MGDSMAIYRNAKLIKSQKKEIQSIFKAVREVSSKSNQEIYKLHKDLIQLARSDTYDKSAAEHTVKKDYRAPSTYIDCNKFS